jgi:3'-5' exonuclease
MITRVFCDIETLPPSEDHRETIIQEVIRDLKGKNSQFDDEKVTQIADERFRQLALKGEYGRVLTIGLVIERDNQIVHKGVLGIDRATRCFHLDETRTLRSFWKLLRDFNRSRDTIVGHNIFEFDLLFLYKRSIINRVRPTIELSFARYRSQPIYDTMFEWERWGRNRISLAELAKVLHLESSKQNGLDGSHVYDYFMAGRHEEIADYCKRDVALVRTIYYQMKFLEMGAPLDLHLATSA